MAPFVTRKSLNSNIQYDSQSKNNKKPTKLLFLHKLYNNFVTKKIHESNRICGAFLATLSALCISLVVTSIYVMFNGKLSVAYFFTFFF